MIKEYQDNFLRNEVWLLSFGGAFQRNTVYKPKTSEKKRLAFRLELREHIETTVLPLYKKKISDKKHSALLIDLIDFSKYHAAILKGGALTVGTAQKLLNLLLKYYWCLGWLPEPPHFPIDSRIQKCLPANQRKSWTQINSLDTYQVIIDCARQQLDKKESLAQWELVNFKRNG